MKTVLKLVVAVALLNAVVRAGGSAWNYYQLKDTAERALLFGGTATSQQLHERIMESAMELELPLKPEDLRVRWRPGRRVADAQYTQQIEVFPNFPYPVVFSFTVEAIAVGTPPDDDDYPPVYSGTKSR